MEASKKIDIHKSLVKQMQAEINRHIEECAHQEGKAFALHNDNPKQRQLELARELETVATSLAVNIQMLINNLTQLHTK